MSGDSYKRREVSPGVYQCGCRWERLPIFGDVMRECIFHAQITAAHAARTDAKAQSGAEVRR